MSWASSEVMAVSQETVEAGEDTLNVGKLDKRQWQVLIRTWGVNFVLLLTFGALVYATMGSDVSTRLPPFVCDDPQLSLKLGGRETVPSKIFLTTSLLLPFVWILFVECCNREFGLKAALIYSGIYYFHYLIGYLYNLALQDVLKTVINEPRPHFIDSCRPNVTCAPGTMVTDYECTTGLSPYNLRDIKKSFPSGHAGLSVYMATYLALHVQQRIGSTYVVLKPWLHLVLAICAIICSTSRVIDHRHHWGDVVGGALIGACVAWYIAKNISNHFKRQGTVVNQ